MSYNFNKGLATKKQLDEFYKMARNLKTEVKRGRPEYIGRTKFTYEDKPGDKPARGRQPDPSKVQKSSSGFVRPRMGLTQVGEGFKPSDTQPILFNRYAERLKVEPKRGIDKPISGWAKMNVSQKQKAIIDYYTSIAQKGGTGILFLNPILDPFREDSGIEREAASQKAAAPPIHSSVADLLSKRAQPTTPREIPQKYKRVRGRKDFDESIKTQFPQKRNIPPLRNQTKPPPIKKAVPPPLIPKIKKATPPPIVKDTPPKRIRKKTKIIKKAKEAAPPSPPPRAGRDLLNFGGKRTSSGNANIGLRKDGTNGYTAGNIMTLLQDRDNIVKIPKVKKAEMKKLIDEVLRKKGNVTVNQAVIEIRKLL